MQISKPVKRCDHDQKMTGSARYVDDHPRTDMLYGTLVRSAVAHGRIRHITYPALPPGYTAVDSRDIPGKNSVHIVQDDCPIFSSELVSYVGDPIAMIVGPNPETVRELCTQVQVSYTHLPAVLDMDEADTVFFRLPLR